MKKLLKSMEKFYKVAIIIADLVIINLSYIVAFLIKFSGSLPEYNFVSYVRAIPFITIAALIYFDAFGMLKFYRRTAYETVSSILVMVFMLGVTTTSITYFLQGFSFPRSVLIMSPMLQAIFLSTWKVFLLKMRSKLLDVRNAMIIGDISSNCVSIEKIKAVAGADNVRVKYIFDPHEEDEIFKRINDVSEIFICSDVPAELKMKIISKCLGKKQVIYLIPHIFEISILNSRLIQFSDIPTLMIGKLDLTIEQRFFKRLFDIAFSLLAILVLSPVMVLIALLVKITSDGPAIYSQERVTKDGKTFKLYKFRTMIDGAEEKTGPVLSTLDDPRITPLGRFLRKTRLDEIPQFFNVLKGEMSMVGPRPERPCFVEQYCIELPEYGYRNVVKAGITGFAQVLGYYDTTPDVKLRYDLMYIRNYSLLLDIKLIIQTLKVVLTGNNLHENEVFKNDFIYDSIKKEKNLLHM